MHDQTRDNPAQTYEDFLAERHSHFNTPLSVIAPLVQRATQSEVVRREKIIAGEENEVYSVETSKGDGFIVRISRREKPVFESEKFALDKAREAGVPTPKVLLIKKV